MQQEKLAEDLSNCRAIESSLKDAFTSIKVRDATHPAALFPGLVDVHDQCEYFSATTAALTKMHSAPTCHTSKPSCLCAPEMLTPTRRLLSQAQLLVEDLRWLNRDFTSRWRTVIFSRSSPVSWRWRATLRALFAFTFLLIAWCTWIALRGAYRAHRQRLVWGERLIS